MLVASLATATGAPLGPGTDPFPTVPGDSGNTEFAGVLSQAGGAPQGDVAAVPTPAPDAYTRARNHSAQDKRTTLPLRHKPETAPGRARNEISAEPGQLPSTDASADMMVQVNGSAIRPQPVPPQGAQMDASSAAVIVNVASRDLQAAVLSAPATTASAVPPAPLAFAARVQPISALADSQSDSLPDLRQEVSATVTTALRDLPSNTASDTFAVNLAAAAVSSGSNAANPTPETNTVLAPSQVLELTGSQPDVPIATKPISNISLQIESVQGQKPVQVDLVTRAGQVSISVRTGSGDVATNLRQSLPELTSRLTQAGFHADTWHPGVQTATASGQTADTSGQPNSSKQGEGQPQSGYSQQDSGRREQDQPNRPRWVDDLETAVQSGPKTGENNGFTR